MSDQLAREGYLKEAIDILTRLSHRLPDVGSKGEVLAARRNVVAAMSFRDILSPENISSQEKEPRKGGTRQRTAFFEVNGERKHLMDWAEILHLSAMTLRNYIAKGQTMQDVYDYVTSPDYVKGRKDGHKPKPGHAWTQMANRIVKEKG